MAAAGSFGLDTEVTGGEFRDPCRGFSGLGAEGSAWFLLICGIVVDVLAGLLLELCSVSAAENLRCGIVEGWGQTGVVLVEFESTMSAFIWFEDGGLALLKPLIRMLEVLIVICPAGDALLPSIPAPSAASGLSSKVCCMMEGRDWAGLVNVGFGSILSGFVWFNNDGLEPLKPLIWIFEVLFVVCFTGTVFPLSIPAPPADRGLSSNVTFLTVGVSVLLITGVGGRGLKMSVASTVLG